MVPLPGSKYDVVKQKVVVDQNIAVNDRDPEERLARVLCEIADNVLPEIKMLADFPSKNNDKKMAVLDMKVWLNEEGFIMHEHYEKSMSSKKMMHATSAISALCKQSVRRFFNSSRRLDWKDEIAPVISEYMTRMMHAGYLEKYMALRIYDKMVEDDRNGLRPIYRPKDFEKVERQKRKQKKKHNWSNKGG